MNAEQESTRRRWWPQPGIAIAVGAMLIALVCMLLYNLTQKTVAQIDEKTIHTTDDRLGVSKDEYLALHQGMSEAEVRAITGTTMELNGYVINIPPAAAHTSVSVGFVRIEGGGQGRIAFVEDYLVGLDSFDPEVGPPCGGCLRSMMEGTRAKEKGLPLLKDGKCPECGADYSFNVGPQVGISSPVPIIWK